MEVKNCKVCKRMFNYIAGEVLCPACRDEMEVKFRDIKDYLWEHKNSSVDEVAEKFEIPKQTIFDWIRQGRLQLSEDSMIRLTCERCGSSILTGMYCAPCQRELKAGFGKYLKRETPSTPEIKKNDGKDKMRFTHHK